MKATGRADMAANSKVLDLYAANLQLEEQLQQVQREVEDAKSIAGKVRPSHHCLMQSILRVYCRRTPAP